MTRPSGDALRVLLIGATGPLGRAVLAQADPERVSVRAFARQPGALNMELRDLSSLDEVVQGDVRDASSLSRALNGIDAVICTLGGKPWHANATGVHEVGTANLIEAMRHEGCSRLITVTGVGAGSSKGHGPFYYNWFARPTVLRAVYEDKERQEALIQGSDLDWTIVRPALLVRTSPAKPIRARTDLRPREVMGSISRTDVATFLLNEVTNPAHNLRIVHLFT